MTQQLIRVPIKQKSYPANVTNCTNCAGTGYMMDGSFSVGPDLMEYKSPSKCANCRGSGLVSVLPYDPEQVQRER